MPSQHPSFVAGATVQPRRFVKLDGLADYQVIHATAGDFTVGITHKGTKFAPIPEVSTNPHANAGDPVAIHGDGETCELDVGTVAVSAGDLLKPDANGKAVAAVAGDKYGAEALAAGPANELVRVRVIRGELET